MRQTLSTGPPRRDDRVVLVRGAQLALVGAWLLAWELTARQEWITPVLAASPAESWHYVVEGVRNGELVTHTRATLTAVVVAWTLAGAAGVVAGIGLALLPTVERVLAPFLDAANAMPRIALAPFFIIALGIGLAAKVALAATLVFFIVLSGSRAGVRSADPDSLRLSAVLGASRQQLFWKVLVPVAAPAIMASLRLGLVYALLGVVGSEIISARDGLGQLISGYSALFRMEAVYAILLLLAVVAALLNLAMRGVERLVVRWEPPAER